MGIYTYRIVPVHYTDIDGMETWLEEMAAKGYVLGQEGIFSGLVAFEKTEPKRYKYRLIANPFKYDWTGGRWNRYAPVPDEKTQEFHREFGWEYVATRKDFNIYCAKDPNAPEMETDPQIQATAIHAAARRKHWDIFGFSLILLVVLLGTLWLGYDFLRGERTFFDFGLLLLCPMWLLFLLQYLYAYVRLKKLEKSLQSGYRLSHRSDYRRRRNLYWFGRGLTPVCLLLTFVLIWNVDVRISNFDYMTDLKDYTGEIPFATMEELLPEAKFREDIAWNNSITVRSSPIAEVYDLSQQLHITLPDGAEVSGSLDVAYRRMHSAEAARSMAEREYRESNRTDNEPREISIEGVDYAFVYDNYVYDYVVLCKGNIFVSADFRFSRPDSITAEEIGKIMAASIA